MLVDPEEFEVRASPPVHSSWESQASLKSYSMPHYGMLAISCRSANVFSLCMQGAVNITGIAISSNYVEDNIISCLMDCVWSKEPFLLNGSCMQKVVVLSCSV